MLMVLALLVTTVIVHVVTAASLMIVIATVIDTVVSAMSMVIMSTVIHSDDDVEVLYVKVM